MSNHINKLLILALGIAIGVIVMLIREKQAPQDEPTVTYADSSQGTSILPPPARTPTPTEPARQTAAPKDVQDISEDDTATFKAEIQRVLRGEASEEEQLAFWQNIQTSKKLDAVITELQETANADPEDVASRLSLAQAYVTKLLGTPSGPARGLWAAKAEGLWTDVLDLEPDNWDAQRNIAFSYSQYPDFMNKTGAAISAYEKTVALQENAQEPRSSFAKSYLELAKLHVKNGDPSSALASLEQGTAAHPDDADLAEQLRVISSSYKFEEVPAE